MLPMLALVFLSGRTGEYLSLCCAMTFHELAHLSAAGLYGRRPRSFSILPTGMNIVLEDGEGGRAETVAILACGPAANIFLSGLSALLGLHPLFATEGVRFFSLVNLYLAVFNLLPVLPLDGGRLMQVIFSENIGFFSAGRKMRVVSFIFAVVILAAGVVQVSLAGYNMSLLFIGIYILFYLNSEKMEAALMNMKHIVYRRSRLLKKGMYPARDIVVMKSLRICETIKSLDFDRFHILHVLNEDLRVIGVYTEQEIMEGLLEGEADITFEEFMKKRNKKGDLPQR